MSLTTSRPDKKHKILFVCLGNICRSPAAEGIMRAKVAEAGFGEHYTIDSAGTYGGHSGELPDPRMRKAAAARGYDLTHKARQFRSGDFGKFDRIIVMDDSNYDSVCRLAPDPDALGKVYRMASFLTRHRTDHIPDPYYEGRLGFEYVLDLLEDGCEGVLKGMDENQNP